MEEEKTTVCEECGRQMTENIMSGRNDGGKTKVLCWRCAEKKDLHFPYVSYNALKKRKRGRPKASVPVFRPEY